jgi:hypothetical protein
VNATAGLVGPLEANKEGDDMTKMMTESQKTVFAWTMFEIKITLAVDQWFYDQCHNEFGAYYAYYRRSIPGVSECGDIAIAMDCPEGYELGMNERVSPGWEKSHARRFITAAARSWPIL